MTEQEPMPDPSSAEATEGKLAKVPEALPEEWHERWEQFLAWRRDNPLYEDAIELCRALAESERGRKELEDRWDALCDVVVDCYDRAAKAEKEAAFLADVLDTAAGAGEELIAERDALLRRLDAATKGQEALKAEVEGLGQAGYWLAVIAQEALDDGEAAEDCLRIMTGHRDTLLREKQEWRAERGTLANKLEGAHDKLRECAEWLDVTELGHENKSLRATLQKVRRQRDAENERAWKVTAQRDALKARLDEIAEQQRIIMAEPCDASERHCTCVPILRREVERLKQELGDCRNARAVDKFSDECHARLVRIAARAETLCCQATKLMPALEAAGFSGSAGRLGELT